MKCQVCGSSNTFSIGSYQPYIDYSTDVYDCKDCLSRFAPYDANTHEKLHSRASNYSLHADMEVDVKEFLKNGDIASARSYLAKRAANSFIMDAIEATSLSSNLLELGCSRGYLAAYFLATGRSVLGVDVSPTAIEAATNSFGNYFCIEGDSRIEANAPYDSIYHVGTIGCVESPVELTKKLISYLKPGGLLVFNAPNRKTCDLSGRIWLSTPPPDLFKLYHPDFWRNEFSGLVESRVEALDASRLSSGYFRMLTDLKSPVSNRVFDTECELPLPFSSKMVQHLKTLYFSVCYSRLPNEYGIHVLMKRMA